jgi:hypothetical protein
MSNVKRNSSRQQLANHGWSKDSRPRTRRRVVVRAPAADDSASKAASRRCSEAVASLQHIASNRSSHPDCSAPRSALSQSRTVHDRAPPLPARDDKDEAAPAPVLPLAGRAARTRTKTVCLLGIRSVAVAQLRTQPKSRSPALRTDPMPRAAPAVDDSVAEPARGHPGQ